MSNGDNWVTILIGNLKYVMFFAGMLMCIITPFYLFRCLKRRRFEDIGRVAIMGMFGIAFLLAGLLWG